MLEWTPEELEGHLAQGHSVFLKLWKTGCGACNLSKPAVKRVEEKYGDQIVFGQINALDHPEILEIADTEVLPVFFLFKEKKLLGKLIGFKGQAKLQEFVETNFSN